MSGVMFYYLEHLPDVRAAARGLGYAVGLHGSMERDFDLIACPWTDDAAPAEQLVEAVRKVLGGLVDQAEGRNPTAKPHGRLAWAIHLHGGGYVDLSVMPRREDQR